MPADNSVIPYHRSSQIIYMQLSQTSITQSTAASLPVLVLQKSERDGEMMQNSPVTLRDKIKKNLVKNL